MPEPNPNFKLSQAAMSMFMGSALARWRRLPGVPLDDLSKQSTETHDVLMNFVDKFPDIATPFLTSLGIDDEQLRNACKQTRIPEPQPDPPKLPDNPSEEKIKLHKMSQEMYEERIKKGEAAPFSKPLKETLAAAKREAAKEGKPATIGIAVYALCTVEGSARAILLELSDHAKLEQALEAIKAHPEPEEPLHVFNPSSPEMLDLAWEKAREEQGRIPAIAKMEERMDAEYEKNPANYEQTLNVAEQVANSPATPEQLYTHCVGIYLHAAENEARIRKSKQLTLDHMLLVLLQEGTDTNDFLKQNGIDPKAWKETVEQQIPTEEEGPRWPPKDRALGMSIPSNVGHKFLKPIPEDEEVPREKAKEYIQRVPELDKHFTDLHWLYVMAKEPPSIGYRLLAEANITEDQVKGALQEKQTRDPDWWKRRPSLEMDRESEDLMLMGSYQKADRCWKAAEVEARLHHAPTITFDHLVLALLAQDTHTARLVESLGIPRAEAYAQLDALVPKFESGPMFPADGDDDLRMAAYFAHRKPFSDLQFILEAMGAGKYSKRELSSPALDYLRTLGITEALINATLPPEEE